MKRRGLSILLALCMVLALLPVISTPAQAAVIGDDYPANLKAQARDAIVDQWNFYNRECTSFVAWRLNSANGVAFHNYYGGVHWGNASNWGYAAQQIGIAVDSNPVVGSVAWMSGGHVAWVAAVDGNNVTVEEYNWDGDGLYHCITWPKSHYTGFIHIKDYIGSSIFDTLSASSITTNNAVIEAWVTGTGVSSERGFYIGTSKETMTKVPAQVYNADWTRYHLCFDVGALYGDLSTGQTYFYKFYTIVDGKEYCSELDAFYTLGLAGVFFDTMSSSVSEDDAYLSVWVDNANAFTLTETGIQLGRNVSSLESKTINTNVSWTRPNLRCYVSQYFGKLIPGQKYLARYYAKAKGNTYYSDYFVFTTPADITFDPISAADITFNSATISCWMSNDKAKTVSSFGFEWKEGDSSAKRTEIRSGIQWTRANLNYSTNQYIGPLKPETDYSFRYYVISDGVEYFSDTVSFQTDAHQHNYDSVITMPTCTDQGYTTHTCTTCGDSYVDSETAALGHSWDSGVVTQQPTATAEGVKTYTCTVCGETKTEAIAKLVNPFVDVANGKFYFEPVLWAFYSDPQVTSGVTKTTFEPDRICTRAHVVAFLWRANGCPEPQSMTSSFKDVKDTSKYYYKAVLWAAEQGITTGYSDGTFRPDDECTRGQVVTFLWRAKGQPTPASAAIPFTDVPAGKYYTLAVLWALQNNITQGRTATTFGPDDACTRGHVVTFLYRACA